MHEVILIREYPPPYCISSSRYFLSSFEKTSSNPILVIPDSQILHEGKFELFWKLKLECLWNKRLDLSKVQWLTVVVWVNLRENGKSEITENK